MAFEINFNNPTDGGTAFLASYLGAKKKADAETARLKAQQRQRMADTIGGAIGNVGGSFGRGWSEGVVNRYRMQDQQKLDADRAALNAKYQEQRDARSFDYDKQLTKYRSDLNRDDRFYDNFQMSPDDAESLGQREWESAPPQVRGQIASSLGLDPEQADTLFAGDGPEAKALRRQTAITSIRMREQGAKVQQAEEIAKVRRQQAYLAEQDNQRMQRVEGWKSQQYRVNDSKIEGSLRTNQTAIDSAAMDGNWSDQEIAAAQARQDRDVARYLNKMEPVKKPPKTFKDLEASGDALVDRELGVAATYNPKTQQWDMHNLPKPDKQEPMGPKPPPMEWTSPQTGVKYYDDGNGWKPHKADKPEAEKADPDIKLRENIVKNLTTKDTLKGVAIPPKAADVEKVMRLIKSPESVVNEPNPVLTTPDAQGYSYMDRVQYAVDKNPDPAAVNAMIGRFKIATELKQELYDFAKSRRESKQPPQQQAAPASQPLAQSNPLQEIQAMIGQYGPDKTKWPPDALERALRIKHAMRNAAGK